ncbi:MAG: hypothetical protein ACREPS_11195, partial [Rhodanobacteraceae bacterium]
TSPDAQAANSRLLDVKMSAQRIIVKPFAQIYLHTYYTSPAQPTRNASARRVGLCQIHQNSNRRRPDIRMHRSNQHPESPVRLPLRARRRCVSGVTGD